MIGRFTDEIVALSRFFGAFERDAVCCGTITVSQCIVLQQLARAPGDMSSLAARAGLTLSAMSRLVDGLAERGWVERRRAAADRRKVVVALSDAGRTEAGRLRQQTMGGLERVVVHIPSDQRQQVLDALRLVRAAVEAAGEIGCCSPPATGGDPETSA